MPFQPWHHHVHNVKSTQTCPPTTFFLTHMSTRHVHLILRILIFIVGYIVLVLIHWGIRMLLVSDIRGGPPNTIILDQFVKQNEALLWLFDKNSPPSKRNPLSLSREMNYFQMFKIKIFKSSGDSSSYRNVYIYHRKLKYRNVSFSQYCAAPFTVDSQRHSVYNVACQ